MTLSSVQDIDAIIYINLEHRKDRKALIEKEIEKLEVDSEKIYRINAIADPLNGTRGCAKSHILALELAIKMKCKNVLILEDDCLFTANKLKINEYIATFFNAFLDNWDVFFLGTGIYASINTKLEDYVKIIHSTCAHAYLVNSHYFETLKNCFSNCVDLMKNDLFFHYSLTKAIDNRWQPLQQSDRWYSGKNIVAHQRKSFSDIGKEITEKKFKRNQAL